MAHKDRKTRKMRGSRMCGYGNTQKHRGAGSRGGRGMAGSKKHKWMGVSKNMPGYFGGHGFKRPQSRKTNTVNVGYINEHIDGWVDAGAAKKEKDGYSINLGGLGISKLLGAGNITKKVSVTVKECSAGAQKKIEEAGGRLTTTKQKTTESANANAGVKKPKQKEVSDETGVPETAD